MTLGSPGRGRDYLSLLAVAGRLRAAGSRGGHSLHRYSRSQGEAGQGDTRIQRQDSLQSGSQRSTKPLNTIIRGAKVRVRAFPIPAPDLVAPLRHVNLILNREGERAVLFWGVKGEGSKLCGEVGTSR